MLRKLLNKLENYYWNRDERRFGDAVIEYLLRKYGTNY